MHFNSLTLHPDLVANVITCGYTEPTPIQEKAIPVVLSGRDAIALAQTGTGKTASFVLPLLHRLLSGGPRKRVRALIIAPTRELAKQIDENVIQFAKNTGLKSVVLYGGVGKHPQIQAIRAGAEIVIACPGRLLDLLNEKHISLANVETLILDEADHMFDKGFLPDIRRIVKKLPVKRQSLVFSATMPAEISHLVEEILSNPCHIKVNHLQPVAKISHSYFRVDESGKRDLLHKLLIKDGMTSAVVFTRTKHKAKKLALQLEKSGVKAVSLQGNLSQQKRQQAITGFKDGTFRVLVATDIAARGIDVPGISHVINYDIPDTAETYVHRVGRTGRAELYGQAITFVGGDGLKMIPLIERNLGRKLVCERTDASAQKSDAVILDAAVTQRVSRRNPAKQQKKTTTSTRSLKSRRDRSCNFDFGLQSQSKRR